MPPFGNEHYCLVGTARVCITPEVGMPYLGYGWDRQDFFLGVSDDLWARALVIDDGERTAALIACDMIGFPPAPFAAAVRAQVATHTSIPGEHVMLSASHAHSTHAAIDLSTLDLEWPWVQNLANSLAGAAIAAWQQREPASIKVGSGEIRGISQNRRVFRSDGKVYRNWNDAAPGEVVRRGPIDPEVGVLLAQRPDGTPLAVLSNFTAHPICAMSQPLVSADFPGFAMAAVEAALGPGVTALFTQGACGDINPPMVRRNIRDAREIGLQLGGEVLRVAASLLPAEVSAVEQRVQVQSQRLRWAYRTDLPSKDEAERAYAAAKAQVGELERGGASATEVRAEANKHRVVLEQYELTRNDARQEKGEIQVMVIGDSAWVGVPGELFCQIGLDIKGQSPFTNTFIVGYANCYQGYFPTPIAYEEGGYEVNIGRWSRFTAVAGESVQETAFELLYSLQ
ncbi:MAG: neutral/alkaline non-lysosomal ceramidase N-terminal domain-containing protein [Chloroflexota bacterium]|nr:neutral/alkaline non-lysosomal ceramidase N-terminal domain-containing protein [Chloroflexota bacterium]